MPSYAILGSTGNVGLSLVKILLKTPDAEIHAYCRSRSKLAKLLPSAIDDPRVKIFEGSLDDASLLSDCIRDTRAVFLVIAENGNKPGTTLAQTAARHILSACETLHEQRARVPRLIVLSSASTEHRLMSGTPHFLLNLLYRAFSNIYDDLKAAEEMIRGREELVSATFIKPAALTHGEQTGHAISFTEAKSPGTFLGLAAGMIEVADDGEGRYEGKAVAVNATGKVPFPKEAPLKMLKGLISHFFPFMYSILG